MKVNIYCNKDTTHIDALRFAVYCINNGIPLDELSDEEIEKVKAKYNENGD